MVCLCHCKVGFAIGLKALDTQKRDQIIISSQVQGRFYKISEKNGLQVLQLQTNLVQR